MARNEGRSARLSCPRHGEKQIRRSSVLAGRLARSRPTAGRAPVFLSLRLPLSPASAPPNLEGLYVWRLLFGPPLPAASAPCPLVHDERAHCAPVRPSDA